MQFVQSVGRVTIDLWAPGWSLYSQVRSQKINVFTVIKSTVFCVEIGYIWFSPQETRAISTYRPTYSITKPQPISGVKATTKQKNADYSKIVGL